MLKKVDEPLVVIDGNNSLLSNCFNYTLMLKGSRFEFIKFNRDLIKEVLYKIIMRTRCYRDESERN